MINIKSEDNIGKEIKDTFTDSIKSDIRRLLKAKKMDTEVRNELVNLVYDNVSAKDISVALAALITGGNVDPQTMMALKAIKSNCDKNK